MRFPLLAVSIALLYSTLVANPLHAQTGRKQMAPPTRVTLQAKDGFVLHATYFAGLKGKTAIPIIMLPGWERTRAELAPLAAELQKDGNTVLTVDLRGHGDSKKAVSATGEEKEFDLNKVRRNDFAVFVQQDLEAAKSFLLGKNNEGECNIELLTIVGCDFSTVAAIQYTQQDWNWPRLAALKQGQDVSGLVLVSPPKSFKGFSPNVAMKHPAVQSTVSMMFIVGERNRNDFSDAKRLFSQIEKLRIKNFDKPSDRTVFLAAKPTDLSGQNLLLDPNANCLKDLKFFINVHMNEKQQLDPWTDRTPPN